MNQRVLPVVLTVVLAAAGAVVAQRSPVRADLSAGDRPVLVPIAPCRLTDTRPSPNTVGPRVGALGPRETVEITAIGENGRCDIPSDALALSLNVTALGATDLSFLTFWPDGERPLAASLNPAPGQPPVPNAVTTSVGADGAFRVYNEAGAVDVVIDVNGYFAHHDHDDRYDTSDEVDAKIADATAGIPGAGTSYTKTESDARYYERSAVDAAIVDAIDGIPDVDAYTRAEADDRFYEGDRVVIVPADGTPAENGAEFEAALAAITGATADSPFHIRLGAGVFDVGDDGVSMVDHVSVMGAGPRATIITGPGQTNGFNDDRATVLLADEMVLSDLTVRTTGGTDTYAAAIVGTGADWLVRNVRVEVEANDATFATGVAMPDLSGSFEFFGVLDGIEVVVSDGTAPADTVRGIGSFGFNGDTTAVTIVNSRITLHTPGTAIGELAADSGDTFLLVKSTVIRLHEGGVGVGLSGHDRQIFDDVDIRIEDGSNSGTNYGMQSAGSGMRPTITDSRIEVFGSGSAVFRTNTSTITVSNSHLRASSVGMDSFGTTSPFVGTYRFDNTTIDAPTAFRISTSGSGTYRFEFGGGKLDANTNVDVTNTGTGSVITTCVNAWDENYVPVNSDCS